MKCVETTAPKTQREVELDRKESYLKQLEEEQNRKEESLRARILENSSANSVPVETVNKVDVTHFQTIQARFINFIPKQFFS